MATTVKVDARTFIVLGTTIHSFEEFVRRFGYTYPKRIPADIRRALMMRDYKKISEQLNQTERAQ